MMSKTSDSEHINGTNLNRSNHCSQSEFGETMDSTGNSEELSPADRAKCAAARACGEAEVATRTEIDHQHSLCADIDSETMDSTGNSEELSPADRAKCAAARACGEAEVRSGMKLGVGSGTTMKFFIDWLRWQHEQKLITNIRCVPTSIQTRHWLLTANLSVYSPDELDQLDLAIDGADEVDEDLNCIKGGGGCLLQEKIVQSCAKRFVIIGGLNKYSQRLGQSFEFIPVEISPIGYVPIQRWITEKFGGECSLRMFKCSPIDWKFPKSFASEANWKAVNRQILCLPGVAETGLFIGVAEKAFFATPEGQVQCVFPKNQALTMSNFRLFFLLFLLLLSFNISTTQNGELDNKDKISREGPRPPSQFRVNEPLYSWMGGAAIVLLLLALLVVAGKLFRNHQEKRRGCFCPGESPKMHIDHKQQLPYLSSFRALGGEGSDQSLQFRHQIHKFRSRRFHLLSAAAVAVPPILSSSSSNSFKCLPAPPPYPQSLVQAATLSNSSSNNGQCDNNRKQERIKVQRT
uniref:ribose-5-phosphate isomerase n=1 Tax=Globodera pallida TaxID=36090 RepID=A0A183C1K9_GLOPA